MSGIVVDASITLSWCFPDEQTKLSTQVLDRLKAGEVAIVPAFWAVEVLNTLLVGEKRGRISPAQTQSFLADLRALGPTLDYASVDLYIELAMRMGYPLATLDQPQRDAARALGVECL